MRWRQLLFAGSAATVLLVVSLIVWLAIRTQYRLDHRMIGAFCIIPADAALAKQPDKVRAVRGMLARAVVMGDAQHQMPLTWHVRLAATDYIGLAFTTREQRARWYEALPRCPLPIRSQ